MGGFDLNPDLMKQKLWSWPSGPCVFTSRPGYSDAQASSSTSFLNEKSCCTKSSVTATTATTSVESLSWAKSSYNDYLSVEPTSRPTHIFLVAFPTKMPMQLSRDRIFLINGVIAIGWTFSKQQKQTSIHTLKHTQKSNSKLVVDLVLILQNFWKEKGENLCDFECGEDFLNETQIA